MLNLGIGLQMIITMAIATALIMSDFGQCPGHKFVSWTLTKTRKAGIYMISLHPHHPQTSPPPLLLPIRLPPGRERRHPGATWGETTGRQSPSLVTVYTKSCPSKASKGLQRLQQGVATTFEDMLQRRFKVTSVQVCLFMAQLPPSFPLLKTRITSWSLKAAFTRTFFKLSLSALNFTFHGGGQKTHNKYCGEICSHHIWRTLKSIQFGYFDAHKMLTQFIKQGLASFVLIKQRLVSFVFSGYFCFKTLRLNSQSCFKKQQKLSHDKIRIIQNN